MPLIAQEWQSDTMYVAPGDTVLQLSRRMIIPESCNLKDSKSVESKRLRGGYFFREPGQIPAVRD
jgi:hypothetical protein